MMNCSYKINKLLRPTSLLLLFIFVISAAARGQNNHIQSKHFVPLQWYANSVNSTTYSQKISIHFSNTPLVKALKRTAAMGHVRLTYNKAMLGRHKVMASGEQLTVIEAFEKILQGTNLKMLASPSGQLVIKEKSDPAKVVKQETVSGTVTDAQTGDPLVGANILVVGSSRGGISDVDGHFSLTVQSLQDTLRFTYIGYQTKTVPINGRTTINVALQPQVFSGQQMVVVGYGKQKKSDLTGAVGSINIKKAETVPTTNVAEMLRGRTPGLKVTEIDPRPGGHSSIKIRGTRSILGGNSPLFVVDGVPVDNINDINAEDIASIEVLKDASAEAIYGARGANGVILVTTKKGKAGRIHVNYHGYYTIQKLKKNFSLYNGEQFAQLRREAYRTINNNQYLADSTIFSPFELESLKKHRFVNWQKLVMREAKLTSHDLSLRGGSDKTKYFASIRYFKQQGIIPTSGYRRGSFRLNLDQTITNKIDVKARASLMTGKQSIESPSLNFITISPLAKPFNDDGSLNKHPLGPGTRTVNPLWNIRQSTNNIRSNDLHLDLVGTYDILKNLSYKLKTSISRYNSNQGAYLSTKHSVGELTNGKATITTKQRREFLVENILKYHFQIGLHNQFDITALQSVSQTNFRNTQTIGTDFSSNDLGYNGLSGALNTLANRSGYQRRLLSYMGRIRYSLFNKYLFTLTGRSDGSSVFAASKKRGFFPSAAFAWKIKQENFLQNVNSINQLKLRFSYGSIGNEAIAPYQTLGIVGNFPYVFGGKTAAGFIPGSNLPNPNLTWETSTSFNSGLDFSFLNDRLSGSINYYDTHTRDLLVNVSLPGNTGYSTTITNGGETENNGVGISLKANIIRNNKLNWSVTTTFSRNKNKILKTGLVDKNGNPKDDINDNRFIGHPIDVLYEKKYDGLFQNKKQIENSAQKDQPNIHPGDIRVVDKNHDGKINEDDNFIFSEDPNWYGSISTRLSFKGFDLLADFYIVEGARKLNPFLSVYANGGTLQGLLNGIKVDYWLPDHHTKVYPRPQETTQSYLYSLAVQNASYIRLRTLTLGYTLPIFIVHKLNLSKIRVYVTATNPITITKYKSWSPEVNPNSYPDTKDITFGLDVRF